MEAYGSLNSFDSRRHTVLSYFCLVTKISCKVTKGSFNDFYFFKKQYGNCAMKKNECNTQNRRLLPENNATCVTALTLVFKKFSRLK